MAAAVVPIEFKNRNPRTLASSKDGLRKSLSCSWISGRRVIVCLDEEVGRRNCRGSPKRSQPASPRAKAPRRPQVVICGGFVTKITTIKKRLIRRQNTGQTESGDIRRQVASVPERFGACRHHVREWIFFFGFGDLCSSI